jgi:predicted nucleic acid-binding protein
VTHVYVDTSVLLRVVLDEPDQIAEWDVFEDPVTSILAEVEGLRVIDRATRKATHPRRKPLTEDEANAARTRLHQVLEMFGQIELEPAILAQAGRLAGPLGTLDALHLSTALTWRDRSGITAVMATHDPELGAASARHGLRVIGWTSAAR